VVVGCGGGGGGGGGVNLSSGALVSSATFTSSARRCPRFDF